MPTVRVETSLAPEFFPENFMPIFLVALAELLGKDKKLMKYVFDTNKDMTIVSKIPLIQLAHNLILVFLFLEESPGTGLALL